MAVDKLRMEIAALKGVIEGSVATTSPLHDLISQDKENVLKVTDDIFDINTWKLAVKHIFEAIENNTMEAKSTKLIHDWLASNPSKMLEGLVKLMDENPDFKSFAEKNEELQLKSKMIPKLEHPKDYRDLIEIMTKAAREKSRVKAVSTRHSTFWNDIASTNGYLINTATNLKDPLEVDTSILKDSGEDNVNTMCHFQAGATVDQVQEFLWPIKERKTNTPEKYRYLPNATSGYGLSLAGTIGTAAHGNGIRVGIMADAVLSFRIVTIDKKWNVKQYQVEPADGITDPAKFAKNYKDIELIQNDNFFNASVVNIGCMGIVYSYILQVAPACYLEEERNEVKWNKETKQRILELMTDVKLQSFQLMASPYSWPPWSDGKEVHIVISTLKYVNPPPHGKRPDPNPGIPVNILNKVFAWITNHLPKLVPFIMSQLLHALAHGPIVINAPDALNTLEGVVPEGFSGVQTSECGMDADKVIEISDNLFAFYQSLETKKQFINVPIAFRFTRKTTKCLAMQNNRQSLMIEQSILKGTNNAVNTLQQYRERMRTQFNGRPHWGMLQDMDAKKLRTLYGEQDRKFFRAALEKFDPNKVFTNDFTKKVFDW